MSRDLSKIVLVSPEEICSNFDFAEEELHPFIQEANSDFKSLPEAKSTDEPEDSIAGDISGLATRLSNLEHKQEE